MTSNLPEKICPYKSLIRAKARADERTHVRGVSEKL